MNLSGKIDVHDSQLNFSLVDRGVVEPKSRAKIVLNVRVPQSGIHLALFVTCFAISLLELRDYSFLARNPSKIDC